MSRKRGNPEAGFSLLDATVAAGVAAVMFTSTMGVLTLAQASKRFSEGMETAWAVLVTESEQARVLPLSELTPGTWTPADHITLTRSTTAGPDDLTAVVLKVTVRTPGWPQAATATTTVLRAAAP